MPRRRPLALLRAELSLHSSLRVLWFFGILWCELGAYRYAVWICGWPDNRLKTSSAGVPTHVLLITDPQVRHSAAHRQPRFSPGLHDWFYHAGLRRSWRYANNLRPDAVIFLGDMLASGRKIKDDDAYVENYHKFKRIFSIDRTVPVFHVPGNEDVGLNLQEEDAIHAQRRYSTHFGPLNSEASISNHSFVFINAPGLVEEDYQRARQHGSVSYEEYDAPVGGTVDFVRQLARRDNGTHKEPAIMFTHIPLFRPDNAGCGPLREHGTIRRGAGPGYQNTFGKRTSEFLLETIKPSRIFSGDDRDYCEYTHSRSDDADGDGTNQNVLVREVTVKSFSPDKSIRHPGFHLLSLVPPDPHSLTPGPGGSLPSLADAPCLLPSQDRTYKSVYLPGVSLTLLVFLVRRVRQHRTRPHPSPLPSYRFGDGNNSNNSNGVLTTSKLSSRRNAHVLSGIEEEKMQGIQRKGPSFRKHDTNAHSAGVASLFRSVAAFPFAKGWYEVDYTSGSVRGASLWRISYRIIVLVFLDFFRVMWPSLILYAAAMWYILR